MPRLPCFENRSCRCETAFAGAPAKRASALPSLEARVGLADHEDLAAAAHDLAVAMALFGGLERGQYFHGGVRFTKTLNKPDIVSQNSSERKLVPARGPA